jgi:hypothetical protein
MERISDSLSVIVFIVIVGVTAPYSHSEFCVALYPEKGAVPSKAAPNETVVDHHLVRIIGVRD